MTPTITHSPCNPNYYISYKWQDQARGVTTWNLNNEYTVSPTIAPEGNATVVFTCTTPKCYSSYNTIAACGTLNMYGQDACMVVYNAWRTSGTNSTNVQLQYILNGTLIGGHDLSEVSPHGATQAFDFVCWNNSTCRLDYNDIERNTLIFHNSGDNDATIQLDHVKIYRMYKMCNPHAEEGNNCTFPVGQQPGCSPLDETSTLAGFDATRIDTPCNCDGGGLSTTHYQDTSHQGHTLPAGETLSWTFNFGTLNNYNYAGKSICLFNCNAMWPMSSMASGDVTLDLVLNDSTIDTFYLSRQGLGKVMQPSHDLAKEDNYYDTQQNVVKLINQSTVDVKMAETNAGIDVYRVFQTATIECCNNCQMCQTCQEPCETCETCYGGCETPCVLGCEIFCYMCETCETACEFACQDCQTCDGCVTCNTSCQWCNTCQPCESCYGCYNSCQLCDTCEGGCLPGCYACQSGY